MNPVITRPDHLRDTRNILTFAALLALGFTGVGIVGESLGAVAYSLLPATLCGVAGIILSLLGVWLAPRVGSLHALSLLILVGYVLTTTLAIHFAGGPQSFLTALYIGITVGAAFLVGRRSALGIALFSAACFSALVGLEYGGVVPIYPLWDAELPVAGRGAVLIGLIFSTVIPTFVVAYVAGTLADRLARRTAEQTALALVARDIASSLNPDDVIRTVLQHAIDHTSSDRGGIYLYDEERGQMQDAALIGFDTTRREAGGDLSRAGMEGIVGRVLRSGLSARVADVSRDPDYVAAATDSRSELCVPILRDRHVEGVINLECGRLNAYTEAHQLFVEQLAQHAAIALSNARLYAKTERNLFDVARANLEIHALQESMAAVQSTLELNAVLQHICDAVVTLGYDLATLAISDPYGRRLALRAVAAADVEIIRSLETVLGVPLVGIHTKLRSPRNIGARALAERKVLVSRDTVDFLHPIGARGPRSRALDAAGLRVGAAIPLIVRDRSLGILYVFSHEPELDHSDLSSLQAFGAQAALALDKANLFAEARTARDRLQAVLDATHDGLIFYDTETRMVLTNRAAEQLLGVALAPHIGKPMAVVLDRSALLERLYPNLNPAERQALIESEVSTLTTGLRDGSSEVARRLISVPGVETRYVEEFHLRVLDEHGDLAGRLVVLHNVTDQKQLEADRDAFTHMLIHDLRSPLSAIIGGLQLIELGVQEGDPPDWILKSDRVALASANKLLGLISSLLDVQKLETGQLELQLHPIDPTVLVNDARETLGPLAEMSNILLEVRADDKLPTVLGDPEHLRRVLINLADNALKFVGEGGRICMSATRDGGFVRFSVADNGPGIPVEYRERIFGRYVQVPGRIARRRGTGLGLTYSKMIVEMHGGSIRVEDSADGGSDFLFTLPVSPD